MESEMQTGSSKNEYKAGELEALITMEKLGFKITYNDDNSREGMPDFRFEDGHYLEVTHTNHRMNREPNKYSKLSLDDQMKIMKKAEDAKKKLKHISCYVDKPDEFRKTVIGHFGKLTNHCSEKDKNKTADVNCEIYTVDNIINKVIEKSEKHHEGTDLFLFVDNDEYEILLNSMTDRHKCGYDELKESFNKSVFGTLYIYPWDSTSQDYKSTKEILILKKTVDGIQSDIKELQ